MGALSQVHVLSLKVGTSHGLWQYKISGTHDRVMMDSLRHVLDRTCQRLGFDRSDRSVVYLFQFSAGPFQGHQVCLERVREGSKGCYYRVTQSTIGGFTAYGLFPAIINATYLHGWPERIYFRLERSLAGGIVS
jgi:hypothetical protein